MTAKHADQCQCLETLQAGKVLAIRHACHLIIGTAVPAGTLDLLELVRHEDHC